MTFKIFSYIKFLLKSTNEHGVHSPFVFQYVTKCLYSKNKLHHKKSINVLLKTIYSFSFEKVCIKKNAKAKELVKQNFTKIQFDENPIDLLFVDKMDIPSFQKTRSEGKLHNDSLILINSIYDNKEILGQWNRLIALPEITVSIDMYHCGLISIRREQVKEHFTIRI
ncbi:hypothetical protein PY092_06800 [Muricauda sp. 334s03]|uniref:Uncharacterized protein n=1 Tax=Flagellimonas yonaguniensis TaxID=3031325 RepID=A0ABT5XXD1_9FLAO|nr:hypothetical protein [[Muricauda] yonaguniensis]MDF0715849.1 hypothetical protein [[Muricauda] yonaguniensis]